MNIVRLWIPLIAAISLSAHALPGDGQGEYRYRVDRIRAEMFGDFKAIESYSHHERIRILQEAEVCIQAAANRDQYRVCEQHEQASRDRLKVEVKGRHEALRARAEALRQRLVSRY
jgi:hypothetical protein